MNLEGILSRMVRIGVVSAVDGAKGKVRVIFRDDNLTSNWLWVLQRQGAGVCVTPSGEHAHTFDAGGSASTEPDHGHSGSYGTGWMPAVNTSVLVLYLPVSNGDGFVLGGI